MPTFLWCHPGVEYNLKAIQEEVKSRVKKCLGSLLLYSASTAPTLLQEDQPWLLSVFKAQLYLFGVFKAQPSSSLLIQPAPAPTLLQESQLWLLGVFKTRLYLFGVFKAQPSLRLHQPAQASRLS